jgi:hypothetical protein
MRLFKLPLPYYGPDDEKGSGEPEKTPAQIERESIKVTSSEKKEEKEEEKVEDEANDKVEVEAEDDADAEVEDETEVEDEKEPKELTAEQKEIAALTKKLERAQRRAGKTAAERDENRKLARELKAALDAKIAEGKQPLTEEEVTRRARELANQDLSAREFDAAQEKLIEDATKIDKTFMSKVRDLAEEVAPLPEFFIGALNDLDNGGAVLNYLTDNPDDYEDLLKKKGAIRVMKGLVEISNKLIEAAKPKIKKISNAPEPAKAPKGSGKNPDQLPAKPTDNMAEFVRIRAAQEKARREQRGD